MRVGILAPPWVPVPAPAYGGTDEARFSAETMVREHVRFYHSVLDRRDQAADQVVAKGDM